MKPKNPTSGSEHHQSQCLEGLGVVAVLALMV